MDWKKLLLGSYDYENTSKDGREKLSVSVKGGLLPSVLVLSLIGWLLWKWLVK